jgi:dolichol-phosphate mannosyltransferase
MALKNLMIIPTYNERDNIVELLKVINLVTPETHVLVVDDNSPDGTSRAVKEYAVKVNNVFILDRKEKNGLGPAYVAGFKWALERGYEFISEMDADWSHPPRFLNDMHQASSKKDFVIGSRYVKGGGTVNWSLIRKFISRMGSLYSRIILGVPINDFTGGFNGWHSKVLKAIDMDTIASDGYSFQIELKFRAARLGFSFAEFPITFEERREGQSKMSARIVREALWRVWTIRFQRRIPVAQSALAAK